MNLDRVFFFGMSFYTGIFLSVGLFKNIDLYRLLFLTYKVHCNVLVYA